MVFAQVTRPARSDHGHESSLHLIKLRPSHHAITSAAVSRWTMVICCSGAKPFGSPPHQSTVGHWPHEAHHLTRSTVARPVATRFRDCRPAHARVLCERHDARERHEVRRDQKGPVGRRRLEQRCEDKPVSSVSSSFAARRGAERLHVAQAVSATRSDSLQIALLMGLYGRNGLASTDAAPARTVR